jgi:hypothetical protein
MPWANRQPGINSDAIWPTRTPDPNPANPRTDNQVTGYWPDDRYGISQVPSRYSTHTPSYSDLRTALSSLIRPGRLTGLESGRVWRPFRPV